MAAHAFGEYTATWWPSWTPRQTGTALLAAFAAIHAWHVRRGAAVQNVILILKLLALLFFVVAGLARLTALEIPAPPPATFHVGAFAVALVWISFSYAGYNAAIYLGGEIVNPDKNLPRSMMAGTLAVVVIYALLNTVFVYAAPVEHLAGEIEVGRLAARALGGEAWAEAVTVLVCAALVTSVSSMTMLGPRVGARMAQDGYLPRWLAGGEATPRNAILFQLFLALIILWTLTFESLLTYIGFTLGLSTAAAVAGLMRLRRREGTALPVPGWPWLPGLFLVCVLSITALTIAERPGASALGLGTLAVGWMLWRWKTYRGSQ
jgi:APA family basic amino acid/polyamine antiporter